MSKPVPLSELDIIDIYNLVNTKIENDKILHRKYDSHQNKTLINFIDANIGKKPNVKPNKHLETTITDEQALKAVLSIMENIAKNKK